MEKPDIGKHDNAWPLWYLNQGTAVTLLFNSDVDNLFTLLLRYFPQALVALAALLALGTLARRHAPRSDTSAGPQGTPATARTPERERRLPAPPRRRRALCCVRCSATSCAPQGGVTPGFEHLDIRRTAAGARTPDAPTFSRHQPGPRPPPGKTARQRRFQPSGGQPANSQERPMSEYSRQLP